MHQVEFKAGDGAQVQMKHGVYSCTIRKVFGTRIVATLDQCFGHLYVPLVDWDETRAITFTKRSDGTFRLRGGKWVLKPGRAFLRKKDAYRYNWP